MSGLHFGKTKTNLIFFTEVWSEIHDNLLTSYGKPGIKQCALTIIKVKEDFPSKLIVKSHVEIEYSGMLKSKRIQIWDR